MTRPGIASVLALAVGACNGSDTAGGACECEQTALATAYDHASSSLGAENVQDAIDELAGRPTDQPIGPRLVLIETITENDGTEFVGGGAACPDRDHDVALGGSCEVDYVLGREFLGSTLTDLGFSCAWKQPLGSTEPLRVSVRCLRNAK